MDYSSSAHNHHEQIQIEAFNVLLLHGTQLRPRGNIHQLWEIAVNINADIAVHGHTHRASIDVYHDKLFLNPGTITGATGGWGGVQEASFIELEAMERNLSVVMHKSDWDVVKVSRIEFMKDDLTVKQV